MTTTPTAGQIIKAANVPFPTEMRANASTDTAITSTTLTDVGVSITFTTENASALVLAFGVFDMAVHTASSNFAVGHCIVDGSDQTSQAVSSMTTVGQRGTQSQNWAASLASAGSHTVKLQAGLSASGGQMDIKTTHTTLLLIIFDF